MAYGFRPYIQHNSGAPLSPVNRYVLPHGTTQIATGGPIGPDPRPPGSGGTIGGFNPGTPVPFSPGPTPGFTGVAYPPGTYGGFRGPPPVPSFPGAR